MPDNTFNACMPDVCQMFRACMPDNTKYCSGLGQRFLEARARMTSCYRGKNYTFANNVFVSHMPYKCIKRVSPASREGMPHSDSCNYIKRPAL